MTDHGITESVVETATLRDTLLPKLLVRGIRVGNLDRILEGIT